MVEAGKLPAIPPIHIYYLIIGMGPTLFVFTQDVSALPATTRSPLTRWTLTPTRSSGCCSATPAVSDRRWSPKGPAPHAQTASPQWPVAQQCVGQTDPRLQPDGMGPTTLHRNILHPPMPTRPLLVPRPAYLDRIVYGTITLMSVLIGYDGWQHLRLVGVVSVIVGPVLRHVHGSRLLSAVARQVNSAPAPTPRLCGNDSV